MFGYKVVIEEECLESWNDGEQWGEWGATYSQEFVKVVKDADYPDIASIFDFQNGDNVFVVWACWNTGDSFGWARERYAEAFGIFKEIDAAKELAEALRKADDEELEIKTSDGQNFKFSYLPFHGYFESLSFVEVKSTVIGASESTLRF